MNTSTKTKTSTMPLKQKANAKCACNSGKKYKKCCKKKVMAEKQPVYRIQDEMTPFKYYTISDECEWNADPATNSNIAKSYHKNCEYKERYKDPSFHSSHPKYCEPENIMGFKTARKGMIHQLQNQNDGWWSHCFQNAYFYARYRGGKVLVGWLLTQTKPNTAHKLQNPNKFPHMKGTDCSFAAELHCIVGFEDGTLYDPTPDYDPTIDVKLWVNDPQLQKMVDSVEGKGSGAYMNMIGTIQDFTPGGSGFLHKHNMEEWRCPLIMLGF